ncbi:hypothetical protein N7530_011150 [Penicillium desertorum]|jgi:hypothetical protein|uniref:Uncharacterized protein n=1 Tax=Penicillium desertorum TaxID=1303715 RepID=A0A9W9WGN6_9EURO|nr:hypothetical protein N7530_011150 [Penicillium desertorum]
MHLNARLSQDAVHPFTEAEDMFDDLKAMFNNDPMEYTLEATKATDDFNAYLCKFLHSAGAQGRPYESLKFELGIRLTERLMRAVECEFHDDFVTFEEFAMFCAEEANRLDLELEQGLSW